MLPVILVDISYRSCSRPGTESERRSSYFRVYRFRPLTSVHRRTARPAKVDALREKLGEKVEVVPVDDLATGDYSEALKGAVDHYPTEDKNI